MALPGTPPIPDRRGPGPVSALLIALLALVVVGTGWLLLMAIRVVSDVHDVTAGVAAGNLDGPSAPAKEPGEETREPVLSEGQRAAIRLLHQADSLCTRKKLLALAQGAEYGRADADDRRQMVLKWLRVPANAGQKLSEEEVQVLSLLVSKRLDDLLVERKFRSGSK